MNQQTFEEKIDRIRNEVELIRMKNRIYSIAQEYGSNSPERYNLLTAYDRIFDALEIIKKKKTADLTKPSGIF